MDIRHVVRAWGAILKGSHPSLSIEVTKECPLKCPGCYAYAEDHTGAGTTLRMLEDLKGDGLVEGVLGVVEQYKPLHLSLVGGDPLVRYRELERLIPILCGRGIHVQVVTSAFRKLPAGWVGQENLSISVSVDGLQAEHDERRKPATYERILANIEGQRVNIHCTITSQMTREPDYLDRFLAFWSARGEVNRIWFSLFTPQVGEAIPEVLTPEQRRRFVAQVPELRRKYPKLDLPESVAEQFASPPGSPEACVFAQTTRTISADLKTRVTPCQLGGNPDCGQCGCYAAMGLAAVGAHRLGGLIPVGAIFKGSLKVGQWANVVRGGRMAEAAPSS